MVVDFQPPLVAGSPDDRIAAAILGPAFPAWLDLGGLVAWLTLLADA
jgi:hypothetical protein